MSQGDDAVSTPRAWRRSLRHELAAFARAMRCLAAEVRRLAYQPAWLIVARRPSGAFFLRWRGGAGELSRERLAALLACEPAAVQRRFASFSAQVEWLNARSSAAAFALRLAEQLLQAEPA